MKEEKTQTRRMPKGGRKGGSVFPRIALNDAVVYARKLVSKTHTGPQPLDVIHSGVVGAKSGIGNVRVSALKQYGFLKGDVKSKFSADELAKRVVAAPVDELIPLYRQAALKPSVFRKLFDTFHGDTISKAKLKQRASDLKVHPDETETCVELYILSMEAAQLITVDGDQVTHVSASEIQIPSGSPAEEDSPADRREPTDQHEHEEEDLASETEDGDKKNGAAEGHRDLHEGSLSGRDDAAQLGPRAIFNINVTLDSSLDTEKLQKQLELLKRFGAL